MLEKASRRNGDIMINFNSTKVGIQIYGSL